jgi:hypothetical protein
VARVSPLRVREYLALPHMIEAAPADRFDGEWVRQLRYRELGGLRVEKVDVETGLTELEVWRIS